MKSRALRSGTETAKSIKPPTKASNAATANNTRRNQTPDAAETAVLAAVGVKPEEFSDTLASCDSSTGHRNPVWFSARPLIAMDWELCSVHDRFCPALSFTTKAAPMSSTDHGGVKRRAFIVGPHPNHRYLPAQPIAISRARRPHRFCGRRDICGSRPSTRAKRGSLVAAPF